MKVIDGPENRVVFIGMDQFRDELLYSSVKGKNPFKDVRVRKALYQAVDIETMKNKLMNGQSFAHRRQTPSPLGGYNDPALEGRFPFDLNAAKKLMAEAGYRRLRGPRSIARTTATSTTRRSASRWPHVGEDQRQGAGRRDAARHLLPQAREVRHQHVHARLGRRGDRRRDHADAGDAQPGRRRHRLLQLRPLDATPSSTTLAAQSSIEADPDKREALIKAALAEWKEQVHTIPLHRQVIPWAARAKVTAVHRADNYVTVEWFGIGSQVA